MYINSRIVCGFFLSWWGGPPQSFERSIWDCVGFYTIHTIFDPTVESQFRIISKSYNFLFGIFIRLLLPSLIVTSSQVRVSMPLLLLACYLWLGARRPITVPLFCLLWSDHTLLTRWEQWRAINPSCPALMIVFYHAMVVSFCHSFWGVKLQLCLHLVTLGSVIIIICKCLQVFNLSAQDVTIFHLAC